MVLWGKPSKTAEALTWAANPRKGQTRSETGPFYSAVIMHDVCSSPLQLRVNLLPMNNQCLCGHVSEDVWTTSWFWNVPWQKPSKWKWLLHSIWMSDRWNHTVHGLSLKLSALCLSWQPVSLIMVGHVWKPVWATWALWDLPGWRYWSVFECLMEETAG